MLGYQLLENLLFLRAGGDEGGLVDLEDEEDGGGQPDGHDQVGDYLVL